MEGRAQTTIRSPMQTFTAPLCASNIQSALNMQPLLPLAVHWHSYAARLPTPHFTLIAFAAVILCSFSAPPCDAGALHPTTFANSSWTAQRVTTLAFGSCMDQARPLTPLVPLPVYISIKCDMPPPPSSCLAAHARRGRAAEAHCPP